jgi:hypothetical protein
MDDIHDLLDHTDEQLALVEQLYRRSLEAKEQGKRLKPQIKNVLDNQRSALDYLAHHIYERHGALTSKGTKAKSYYPIANSPQEFDAWFDKNLPGVRAKRPDIADAIKRHQSWQPDHDWLKWLAGLSVESKHRILTPLENAEGRVTTYRLPNGETIEVQTEKGARFINTTTGEVGDADLFFGEPLTEDSYSDWMFAEPRLPALGVLQTIQTGVRVVVADVGQVAGL